MNCSLYVTLDHKISHNGQFFEFIQISFLFVYGLLV